MVWHHVIVIVSKCFDDVTLATPLASMRIPRVYPCPTATPVYTKVFRIDLHAGLVSPQHLDASIFGYATRLRITKNDSEESTRKCLWR
jgi:hypothetical protein